MRSAARLMSVVSLVLMAAACGAPGPETTETTPTPAPQAPQVIVLDFIAASRDAARTMHAEWHGTTTIAPTDSDPDTIVLTTNAAFDFNGPDYLGTILTDYSFSENRHSHSLALIAGVSFVKLGDHADSVWMRTFQDGERSPIMDPLDGLTVADVAYDSLGTFAGRQAHVLRVLDPLAAFSGDYWLPQVNRAVETDPSEYLIYVDEDGTPVGAHVEFDLTRNKIINGEVSDEPESYEILIDYTFTRWGDPVTITAPPTGRPQSTSAP